MRLSNQRIDIPAGETRTTSSTDSFVLPVDVEVLAVQPHAHYLAREVTGVATLPDGTSRTLISIADWDLRWQHVYRYQTPVPLPKGTTVSMRYRYDNSAANPRNPAAPPVRVPWGQQSREEMGDLWLQVVHEERPPSGSCWTRTFRAKWMATDVIGLESLIRREPDRASLRDDIAVLYMELNRPAEAVPHFEAALRLKPGSASAHFNYGTALAAAGAGRGRGRAVSARAGAAAGLRRSHTTTWERRSSSSDGSQPALASFREAARIDPQLGEAHLNVGSDFARAWRLSRSRLAVPPGAGAEPGLGDGDREPRVGARGSSGAARSAIPQKPCDWPIAR